MFTMFNLREKRLISLGRAIAITIATLWYISLGPNHGWKTLQFALSMLLAVIMLVDWAEVIYRFSTSPEPYPLTED
jgi:acid phosphatase family membrane protein YuiD